MAKIQLGDQVKDIISGFTGITISRTDYLHGCTQWGVKSQELHEGKPISMQWFDEPQLGVVKEAVVAKVEKGSDAPPGGPRATPPSRSHSSSD